SPAARVSDFTRHRGADSDCYATPTPSWNAGSAARHDARRTRNGAVLLLGCEIPGSRYARTGTKANHRDRPDGPLSLQSEPDLSGVLTATARDRDLGQQPVAAGHAPCSGGAYPLLRHTERRAVPGTKIRCPVSGVQGLRPALAVSQSAGRPG